MTITETGWVMPAADDAVAVLAAAAGGLQLLEPSRRFLNLMGFNAEQVQGQSIAEVFEAKAAERIEAAARLASDRQHEIRVRDIDLTGTGFLPTDAVVAPARDGGRLELKLIETPATEAARGRLVGSLFGLSDPQNASTVFVNDLRRGQIRCIHNNLTASFGLPNAFGPEQLYALRHPEELSQVRAFIEHRTAMSDQSYLGSVRRFRALNGEWRTVASRLRVLDRNPDGTPAKMLGFMVDLTGFNTVVDALSRTMNAMARVEGAERARIGRDLHDSLSQQLVGAQLLLAPLRQSPNLSQAERAAADHAADAIRNALEAVRTFSFLLHPPRLKALGLGKALHNLAAGFQNRTDLQVTCHATDTLARQPERVEFALFQIAQEALTNAYRHAHARHIDIRLDHGGDAIRLDIVDDGIGIPNADAYDADHDSQGVGIAGMRARMQALGGQLRLSNLGPGLRVSAIAPLADQP